MQECLVERLGGGIYLDASHCVRVADHGDSAGDARPLVLVLFEVPEFQRLIGRATDQSVAEQVKAAHRSRMTHQSHHRPRTVGPNIPNCKLKKNE